MLQKIFQTSENNFQTSQVLLLPQCRGRHGEIRGGHTEAVGGVGYILDPLEGAAGVHIRVGTSGDAIQGAGLCFSGWPSCVSVDRNIMA